VRSAITPGSIAGLIGLPGLGLFLLLRKQSPIGFWKTALLGTGIAYLAIIAQAFTSLSFGIVAAHVSLVSTLLWYAVVAGESGNPEPADSKGSSSLTSVLAPVCIPVIVFQIVASGSRLFGPVSMNPCAIEMRSWFAAVIILSAILLLGRRYYWRELNWLETYFDKKRSQETTVTYMVMGFVASLAFPFILSDFPNPVGILLCIG
jgi:hypothetical protein